MSRGLVTPLFPNAPTEYNQSYMSQVVSSFGIFLQQVQNPGRSRAAELVLTGLQNDDVGLDLGGVFNHNGFLKITQLNTPHPRGSGATGSVGSVTVSTP